MIDYNTLTAWTCQSNMHWETEIEDTDAHATNRRVTVCWTRLPSGARVQRGWTCTCADGQIASPHPVQCSHVIKAAKLRCGWNSELDPTAECVYGEEPTDGPRCPDCGEFVQPVRVGV